MQGRRRWLSMLDISHKPKTLRSAPMFAAVLFIGLASYPGAAADPAPPPAGFTTFQSSAATSDTKTDLKLLRDMYWLQLPHSGPTATLWDEWLASPSLWPVTGDPARRYDIRNQWDSMLSHRIIDPEGYVATHQHQSIAHQLGWPFPFWNQGRYGFGWHFSFANTVGENWRPHSTVKPDDWATTGTTRGSIGDQGWNIELTEPRAQIAPPFKIAHSMEAPFVQLRWSAQGLENAQPFVEWTTKKSPQFSADKRMYFEPAGDKIQYTMVPVYRSPLWHGTITGLRLNFDNPTTGARVCVQALFSNYDTRHNINNPSYVDGCITYFDWSHDLDFLRRNINDMRKAIRYGFSEFQIDKQGVVLTNWVGHNGRSGRQVTSGTKIRAVTGQGIGSNYWDLLPFGYKDGYATVRWYAAIVRMAQLEEAVDAHPEWNMPHGLLRTSPEELKSVAAKMEATGNSLFWVPETGRFALAVDVDGVKHDFGYTFMNLEAIYYGFATPEHAKTIMSWINGDRTVTGDTATTADIYHWIFAPRASTRRNEDYYGWFWNGKTVPWGTQVQDGGAVLGFSYHDVIARIDVLGPENAWSRLKTIANWYGAIEQAGGYRKYYDGKTHDGNLQGGGTAGGLGMDEEFHESVLLPTTLLDGFMGFRPTPEGFEWKPELPAALPEFELGPIYFRDQTLQLKASVRSLEMKRTGPEPTDAWTATLGPGWKLGNARSAKLTESAPGKWHIEWNGATEISWKKQ